MIASKKYCIIRVIGKDAIGVYYLYIEYIREWWMAIMCTTIQSKALIIVIYRYVCITILKTFNSCEKWAQDI